MSPQACAWLLPASLFVMGMLLLWPDGQGLERTPDSLEYLTWSTRRGFGYPFLLSLTGSGPFAAVCQTALALGCWLYFGYQAGNRTGMILSLLPALALENAQYPVLLLSEALSTPLLVLIAGLSLHLTRKPGPSRAVLWAVLVYWFAFTKTANLYLIAGFPFYFLLYRRARGMAVIAAFTVAVIFLSSTRMKAGHDGFYKLDHLNLLMCFRIFPDEAARHHFEEKGLVIHRWMQPYVEGKKEIAVYNAHRKLQTRELLETYPDYVAWLSTRANREYLLWLVMRPRSYLEAFQGIDHSLGHFTLHAKQHHLPFVSQWLEDPYQRFGRMIPALLWPACLLIPLLDARLRRGRPPFREGEALLLLLPLAYSYAFLSFHGHPGDVSRYLLPVTSIVRLSILFAAVWTVRVWQERRAMRSAPAGF